MDFSGGLGSMLGDIGSSVVSGLFGQHSANRAMKWERKMSNTAYQRAALDLEKAGLNRILALGNPASTPSAQTASMPDSHAGSSFQAGASAKAQRSVMDQQKQLMADQGTAARAAAAASEASAAVAPTQAALNTANAKVAAQNEKLLQEQTRKTKNEADRTGAVNPIFNAVGEVTSALSEKGHKLFPEVIKSFKNLFDFSGYGAGDANKSKSQPSAKKAAPQKRNDEYTRRIRGW